MPVISNEKRSIVYIYKMSFTAFPLIVKVTALDLSGETGEVKYFYEIGNIVVRYKVFVIVIGYF